jgi:hypothetical protein
MRLFPRNNLSLLTLLGPKLPAPALPPDSDATAAFIIRASKLRRGERVDAQSDHDEGKKPPSPGQIVLDAIRSQREGK